MTSKHTALPWEEHDYYVSDKDGNTIALTDNGDPEKFEIHQANAEFIVRACNSHYDLLEALKTLSGQESLTYKEYNQAIIQAQQTLAKATKGD